MTSKVLVFLLLLCTVSCQLQNDEDDGSYNPEKYEKPYEHLVDVNPLPLETTPLPPTFPTSPQNQFPPVYQPPQQVQPFQSPPQQQPPPNPFFQQPPSTPPQPPTTRPPFPSNPFFQQQPSTPPPPPPPTTRTPFPTNPFPQNPFFQQLRNSEPQPQAPSFQQQNLFFQQQNPSFQPPNPVPQNTPVFRPQSPPFRPQQEPSFPPSARDPAPVSQFIDGAQPIQSTNYQTDDGVQRTETRDSEGNVRGQYSYVDPNGKTITVRYTAGKDGFRVEGDHIPKLGQSQPEIEPQPTPQPQPQRQPTAQPQPQFPPPQRRPQAQQFNAIRAQFDQPRSRFNNPAPQQLFNPPIPPRDPNPPSDSDVPLTRSRFVNGIFQPSVQLRNSIAPSLSEFRQDNQQSLDFQK